MFLKILNQIKKFTATSVADSYKTEFEIYINRINISRGKTTAIIFIILEVFLLVASSLLKRGKIFYPPTVYYGFMYILMIAIMTVHLIVFSKFGKDIQRYSSGIYIVGITFAGSILLWCAGISLMDLSHGGQIIVYSVAIIAIAVTPFYQPKILLLMYLTVHAVFLILMVYFHKYDSFPFGNFVNSTSFLIISWAISQMRYKSMVEDFNNRKIIQEKNEELNTVNKLLEESNHKLEKLSQIDSLTDIFNRAVFDRKVKVEWDRCKRHFAPLSLIMIDIDYFKSYNDNYGHQAGDECIRRVASVLAYCAKRSSDTVARYGGEEFVIILPHMEKEKALELANQMRERVEALAIPHSYSSISEFVTISLGVNTVIPSSGTSTEELIRSADKALYKAKKSRNNIVVA